MPLSDIIREKIEYVASYVQGSCTDWFKVKQEIIRSLPGYMRKKVGFSKRHRNTKKMLINSFDMEVINYWEIITGIRLVIDKERMHDPNWVHRPKGWALNGGKEKILQKEDAPKTSRNFKTDN